MTRDTTTASSGGDSRSFIAESWRFPIVDAWSDGANFVSDYAFNSVTFGVYPVFPGEPVPGAVSVIGTFSSLFEAYPLKQVADEALFLRPLRGAAEEPGIHLSVHSGRQAGA